ncbi:MAG: B12-binding domain-containing radical SAM protein [Candidatus Omnitrophica bacterium]|nr:B12-binding domain-containing radical SAM protein [Candidatus Omnitrophota bacterium]
MRRTKILFIETNCDYMPSGRNVSFADLLRYITLRHYWGQAFRDKNIKSKHMYSAPLGIMSLASSLHNKLKDKVCLKLLPINLQEKRFRQEILTKALEDFSPDIAAISNNHLFDEGIAKKVAMKIKEICPGAKIIIGGLSASYRSEELMRLPYVDYVLVGEGEDSFPSLVSGIINNCDLIKVPGLLYRKQGKLLKNNPLSYGGIENQCIDAEILKKFSRDYIPGSFFATVETMRGCPYNCVFCLLGEYQGNQVRFRDPECVVEEITNFKAAGARAIRFIDPNLTIDYDHIAKICRLIKKRGLDDLIYKGQTRTDLIDRETAKVLAEANIRHICLGFETASSVVLKKTSSKMEIGNMRKTALKAVRTLSEQNIDVMGSFVVGMPFETKETIKETEKLINELYDNGLSFADIKFLMPFPGTPMWDNPDYFNVNLNRDFVNQWSFGKICFDTDNFSAQQWKRIYSKLVMISVMRYTKRIGLTSVGKECFSWAVKRYICNRLTTFYPMSKNRDLRSWAKL